ncbi:Signal transducer regulating beta-lactamase production, contains metallopeptidase domain [Salinimicrobium catena]|uniref:Signal transducer regulating beta-lactamase production, contains metallopeptidase domain n=1 Tax=Salinimicrobium catena TaxID=390640 RepID=A0A1H5JQM2_9FLAO|nr:M56 family metallopeptidase [Salinimicrobium catena]SDK89367.1 Signal transducer regulating beta-lactamase production, contains metallopeptidase domain [Salinimicrobium catena]SEE54730.1 Signal transducer regulating beta-lactamase production, contains metallopeptidase domain [Salinimicrobium catena]
MLQYILHTIAFQLIFLLVYELFLKKETFFSYNRAYLLLTPVVSFLLPLIKIPVLQEAVPAEAFVMLPEVLLTGGKTAAQNEIPATAAPETIEVSWWLLVYGAGLLFSLGIFFQKYKVLKELFANQTVLLRKENIKIVEVPKSKIAFTFYETIFLGSDLSEKERKQILSHEMVHVRQRHTLDLLLFEFLRIVFWFNPLIYIYQSRISTLHEYLADAGVVKNVKKQEYFQQLLNSAFNTEDISFINQFFNHSIIKKRIVMLQKTRSRSISKFKFLIILPLMMAMLTYVSCSEDQVRSEEEKELTAQEKIERIEAIFGDGTNLTSEERKEIQEILKTVSSQDLEKYSKRGQKMQVQNSPSGTGDVPFAVIEEVPIFPGCEALDTNEARKKCMSDKINAFVNQNFDVSLGKANDLNGINRVYVQFKITKNGTVEILGARAPHPALKEEAVRVINLLPEMQPGKQGGENVNVLYTLPITLKIGE